jgi:hypothetical protein
MRLLLPAAVSVVSVLLLVVACGGTDTPTDTTPAAGDDDDSGTTTHDASTGDGSTTTTGDGAAASDGALTTDGGTTTPTTDGGDEVACSGTPSCGVGDACFSDYATAQVATNWCRFGGVATSVTEFSAACSGYHVVQFRSGVAGESTLYFYDLTSGALVAIVKAGLTSKSCTGSPAEVSGTPCADSTGVTTELADSCTD